VLGRHVARKKEKVYRLLIGKLGGIGHCQDLYVNGRVIIKSIFNKCIGL
jgi:hypothetical protein